MHSEQTLPLNIRPPESQQKNIRILKIFLCTRMRVIHHWRKTATTRSGFSRLSPLLVVDLAGADLADITLNGRRAELAVKEMAEPGFCRRVEDFVVEGMGSVASSLQERLMYGTLTWNAH
ncbi:hypothetical protein C5167_026797 [Papaver somniferum]|nr:hypothetical protein C5167_026797 [Papaver somniferum]